LTQVDVIRLGVCKSEHDLDVIVMNFKLYRHFNPCDGIIKFMIQNAVTATYILHGYSNRILSVKCIASM